MNKQEAKITYHDKATQTETEEEDTIEKILKVITTLCTKVDNMDNEIQKRKTNEDNLKSKASQQHDCKNAELRRSEDGKNPELKGDDGKLLKTYNVCLNTAAEPKSYSFVQEINPNPTKSRRQAEWAAVVDKGCGSCWNGLVRATIVDVCKLLLTLLGFSVHSRVGEEERERRGHFVWAAVRMFGSL
ncbi:hypothetical protein MTR67_042662 [Solanum verrucosum]|uniref:Uncharacterized protein n=1 Tax=Solanum verrucosum TaxID=315347 RepID=A0AAF0ZRC3_SOLVR|nr:hypothetical protein MTR67_042662 [Solanum verrucosum]